MKYTSYCVVHNVKRFPGNDERNLFFFFILIIARLRYYYDFTPYAPPLKRHMCTAGIYRYLLYLITSKWL